MAQSEHWYISGKSKYGYLVAADTRFEPKWSQMIYPNEDGMKKVHQLMERGLKNALKKDDDGYYITFNRPVSKEYAGKIRSYTPPVVLGMDGQPFTGKIGWGSDITCKLEVYGFRNRSGIAARLEAVRVDNLVPFTEEQFDEADARSVAGLKEAPKPIF